VKKFMELAVLPNMDNKYKKERATDELPQSASGKSIMTCEPKFVPNEAVSIALNEHTAFNVRLVDCVGYMVEGALGESEDGRPRMVNTPWDESPVPFSVAAEKGTRKVIAEHSTIGIVVTTDGSITEIERAAYVQAEKRVIAELKELSKPFVVILNTKYPLSPQTIELQDKMRADYGVEVMAVDVLNMELSDLEKVLTGVLYEFPVKKVTFNIPKWITNLREDNPLYAKIIEGIRAAAENCRTIRDVLGALAGEGERQFGFAAKDVGLSNGKMVCDVAVADETFYEAISAESGMEIKGETDLFLLLTDMLKRKQSLEDMQTAMLQASSGGYGMVFPDYSQLKLEAPKIFSEAGKYGISIKASGKAVHVVESEVFSEISPVIGTEDECGLFYDKLLELYNNAPQQLWNTEIFGRKLIDMISDNIRLKLSGITEETRQKIVKMGNRISNGQRGGLMIFWL
jgi:stage IV sporulation protein A